MRVALFGGTGFVGCYLVKELLSRGHTPVLLVRPGSEGKVHQPEQCQAVSGTISDDDAIRETLSGCDALIYNVGILREFPGKGITYRELHYRGVQRCVDAALEQGVRRLLLMSANGVKPEGTGYQVTKYQAEEYVQRSGLEWTIFRPSLIFGDPRGRMEFATRLLKQVVAPPLPAPLFFNGLAFHRAGRFRLSPVHVRDVAAAFGTALTDPETCGKTYLLAGPRTLAWKEIIKTIGQAVGKNKWTVPVPVWGVKGAACVFDRFAWFPITRDQLTMLLEGNQGEPAELRGLIGREPQPFSVENLRYLVEYFS
jgi:NADH dehydrogenase